MKSFKELTNTLYLNEEKLSRVWALAQKDGGTFGIITAFRGEYTRQENLSRNRRLINDIRSAGFGYWILNGSWIETDEQGKRKEVSEDSLFISAPKTMKDGSNKLKKFIIDNTKKYDQDSAIYKEQNSDDVKLYQYKTYRNNSRVVDIKTLSLGKFNVASIQSAYSKIRGSNRKFVFEGVYQRNPNSFGDAIILSRPDLELEQI